MTKRAKKYLCLVMALVMACTMVPVSYAQAEDLSLPSTVLSGSQQDPGEYFAYYDSHAHVPLATVSHPLALEEATVSQGVTREEYLGKSALLMDAKSTVEWVIQVPADGRYVLKLTYVGLESNLKDNAVSVAFNNLIPFEEAENITLTRLWKDATEIQKDTLGNDRIPEQAQVLQWNTVALQDYAIFTADPLIFSLGAGYHTITLTNVSEAMYLAAAELCPPDSVPSDDALRQSYAAAGYQEVAGYFQKIQAELPSMKSAQSIYPTYDRSNPATEPYSVSHISRNTIGDGNWSEPGSWVSYTVSDVPEDGLYYISIKYRQSQMTGSSTFRSISVNGTVPSEAFESVAFPYNINWQRQTVSDSNGEAIPVYLQKGTNEIRLEATVGKWAEVLRIVEASNKRLNNMYIQIVMITGSTPDKYFDYDLDISVPGLLDCFRNESAVLSAAADEFDRLNGGKTTQSETLRTAVNQLLSMVQEPQTIQDRLAHYRDTISSLSSWVYDNMNQSLELDYIMIHSADAELPKADAGFFAKLWHGIVTFILSFFTDYDTIGATGGEGQTITVWISSGRDQASILMDMITEDFTPKTGIQVKVSLVQTGFIEATLAGTGPDVAIGVARGQPVNLACRGALEDLSQFDTFDEVVSRFADTATVPFQYNGGTYAVPNTQSYFMMFYRKDILEQLGLELPQTWDDLLQLVPRLQKKHMEIGLPYSVISAAAAVDSGMGSKDLFPVLLLQNGGDFYNEDGTATALNSEAGMAAFKQWCEYYQQYGFELVYDVYTRFRNGDMPIAIADLSYYNTLMAGAPEIQGDWGIAPIPGTLKEDGTIDRSTGSAGSSVVMFKNAENKEACWDFIDWWTQTETQDTYNQKIENVMGPAGRNATANLESFSHLPWSEEELAALTEQRKWIRDLREVPGSYFVSRCIDNAFRAVLYDNENIREVFEEEVESIDREIARKRKELGLS